MDDKLKGYKGKAKELLKKKKIEIWDILRVTTESGESEGILLPRNEYSAPDYIDIKLENNYNIGINALKITNIG